MECGIAEATDDKRVYRDFCMAISKTTQVLATMLEHMAIKTREYDTAHTEAMKNSRQHIRLHDLKARGTHAPFAIDGVEGSSKEPTKLSFKGKDQETPTCVCGRREWYNQCGILRDDCPGRPSDFKADPAIAKKVAQGLKDTKLKAKVDKSIKEGRERRPNAVKRKRPKREKTHCQRNQRISGLTPLCLPHCRQLPSSKLMDHGSWLKSSRLLSLDKASIRQGTRRPGKC